MPLVRIPAAFDDPEWLWEIKHDGFRALADVRDHACRLISRRGHEFTKFNLLAQEISHSVHAMSAVLDGELVCLDRDGRVNFYSLLFRRDWPYFYAFDLLSVDGEDLRNRPLIERKRRLRAIMPAPKLQSRLLFVDHVEGNGTALFKAESQHDLEGIVGKWRDGRYEADGISTSWVKIKNRNYSQMGGRRELFEKRADRRQRTRRSWQAPELKLVSATSARA